MEEMGDPLNLEKFDQKKNKRGRQKADFQPYADESSEKISLLQKKINRMKKGEPVEEVVKEEKNEICKRYPHMKGIYDSITKGEYIKMLRNRISALKSRIKKKSEERELKMLRTMARRLYLLKKYDLVPVREFELLKIENDDEFTAIVNYMTSKDNG